MGFKKVSLSSQNGRRHLILYTEQAMSPDSIEVLTFDSLEFAEG